MPLSAMPSRSLAWPNHWKGHRWSSNASGSSPAGVLDEVERAVVGKRDALELVLLGLLADGHVLLEDYPGLAKTLAARSFAQVARA